VLDDERLKQGKRFGKDYFDGFRVLQDQRFESDFDKEMKKLKGKDRR
jgi:hypothetical protein